MTSREHGPARLCLSMAGTLGDGGRGRLAGDVFYIDVGNRLLAGDLHFYVNPESEDKVEETLHLPFDADFAHSDVYWVRIATAPHKAMRGTHVYTRSTFVNRQDSIFTAVTQHFYQELLDYEPARRGHYLPELRVSRQPVLLDDPRTEAQFLSDGGNPRHPGPPPNGQAVQVVIAPSLANATEESMTLGNFVKTKVPGGPEMMPPPSAGAADDSDEEEWIINDAGQLVRAGYADDDSKPAAKPPAYSPESSQCSYSPKSVTPPPDGDVKPMAKPDDISSFLTTEAEQELMSDLSARLMAQSIQPFPDDSESDDDSIIDVDEFLENWDATHDVNGNPIPTDDEGLLIVD